MPELALLQQCHTTNTEFKDIIHKDGRVCMLYKSHLVIVKHINNLVVSTDIDLKSLILEIGKIREFPDTKTWECI